MKYITNLLYLLFSFLIIIPKTQAQFCPETDLLPTDIISVSASGNLDSGLSGPIVVRERLPSDNSPEKHISTFVKFNVNSTGDFDPSRGDAALLYIEIDDKLNNKNYASLKASRVVGGDWSSTDPPQYNWATASRAFGIGSQVTEEYLFNVNFSSTGVNIGEVTDIVDQWMNKGLPNYGFGLFLTESFQGISIKSVKLKIDRCTTLGVGCDFQLINSEDFENSFGIWNDGGSECKLGNYPNYSSSGTKSVRLRGNTSSAFLQSDAFDLSNYSQIRVDFNFSAKSFVGDNKKFDIYISNNGGNSYFKWDTYESRINFYNNAFYKEYVIIGANFFINNQSILSQNTVFKIECEGTDLSDKLYIDDIKISGCLNNNNFVNVDLDANSEIEIYSNSLIIYPNPSTEILNLSYDLEKEEKIKTQITNASGQTVYFEDRVRNKGKQSYQIELYDYAKGLYMVAITNSDNSIKFIKKLIVH